MEKGDRKKITEEVVDEYSDTRGIISEEVVKLMVEEYPGDDGVLHAVLTELAESHEKLRVMNRPEYVDAIYREIGLIQPEEVANLVKSSADINPKHMGIIRRNKVNGHRALGFFPYFAVIRNKIVELAMERVWKRHSTGGSENSSKTS